MRWFSLILAVLLATLPAYASMPKPYPEPYGPQGMTQHYAVVFDGEGEAFVAARLAFQNFGEQPITSLTLELPGSAMRIITALQEVPNYQQQCMGWQESCASRAVERVCTGFGADGMCISWEKPCVSFTRACTSWQNIQSGTTLQVLKHDDERLSGSQRVTLTLARPIAPQESGTLVLSYKAMGYAGHSLGSWAFEFETIKHGSDTNHVRVAVNVQEGLLLKGGPARVSYQPSFGIGAFAAMEKASVGAMASPELRQMADSIRWAPGYVKETSALDPWESFVVKGTYASFWLGLHWKGLFLALALVGLAGAGIIAACRRLKARRWPDAALVLGTGFAAAALEVGLAFLLPWMLQRLGGLFYNELVILLAVLFGGLLVLALAVGPAVVVGVRRGLVAGVLTFASTLAWLFVLMLVVAALLRSVNGGIPLLGRAY